MENLNDRQKIYLLTLYGFDQEAEIANKSRWLYGETSRPAAEWRWIEYGPQGLPRLLSYHPPLRQKLAEKGLVDQGAGSTWNTLFTHGLIERKYKALQIDRWRGETMFVQLTRKGRALARKLTGDNPQKKSSELSKGAWRVLVWAYRVRPKILDIYDVWREGYRKPEPIVIASIGKNLLRRGFVEGTWDHLAITENGRRFCEQNLDHYRELYPDVQLEGFPNKEGN